jgi:hypoxanthine phosphoribosyltransferase
MSDAADSSGVPEQVLQARERAELIVSADAVEFAIDQIAVRLAAVLAEKNPLLLCVMNGGLPYSAELARRLQFPLQLGYVHVGRYGTATQGGTLEWMAQPSIDVSGRHVLFVDDILDEGVTLMELVRWARGAGASGVTSTVLVEKDAPRAEKVVVDYPAMQCPDRYLIGCGMDYQGYWRNLPGIYALPGDMVDAR